MKATINEGFYSLFLNDFDISNNGVESFDEENLKAFNIGDEVEVLKELPIGTYSNHFTACVIFNPKTYASITLSKSFLNFD